MAYLSFPQILIFSVVSFILISNADASQPYELVNKVCSRLEKVNFCLEVLKSDSRSKFAKDVTTLTRIALDVATQNSTKTHAYFQSVKIGPPGVLESLKYCIETYHNVVIGLRICMLEQDCVMTGYDIHIAGDEVRRCQRIADSYGAHRSFIKPINDVTLDLCSLSESLANLRCDDQNKI